jgi:hypothetical protein
MAKKALSDATKFAGVSNIQRAIAASLIYLEPKNDTQNTIGSFD